MTSQYFTVGGAKERRVTRLPPAKTRATEVLEIAVGRNSFLGERHHVQLH